MTDAPPDSSGPAVAAEPPEQDSTDTRVSDQPDALLGKLISERYLPTELIGRGGMGTVYRAEHIHMRNTVALKVLRREMTEVPDIVARFEREAVAAASIEHPNVVHARDFGRLANGAFYLVLEYVEGLVLSKAARGIRFSVARTLQICGQVAEALVAAHARGIIHRDLKPDNIMLVSQPDGSELVKVLDFGIAKLDASFTEENLNRITLAGSIFGTPEYMSPEQAKGTAVDERADLYSLGLIMYRLLAGACPFTGETVESVLIQQINGAPEPLPTDVPEAVSSLVLSLLAKAPEERPQTARVVLDGIIELLGNEALTVTSRMQAHLTPDAQRPSVISENAPHASELVRIWRHSFSLFGTRVPTWVASVTIGFVGTLGVAAGVEAIKPVENADAHGPHRVAFEPAPSAEPTATAPAIATESPPELEAHLGQAFVGNRYAVDQLEARDASTRPLREWLALGRGLTKLQRYDAALDAYLTALNTDPGVANDPALRKDIWEAILSPTVAERALNLAASQLGSDGADMIYAAWVGTTAVNEATRLARELAYSAEGQAHASEALRFLLDWRDAPNCETLHELLPRAALVADRRALSLLNKAMKVNKCELSEEALTTAVSAAKGRSAPDPF